MEEYGLCSLEEYGSPGMDAPSPIIPPPRRGYDRAARLEGSERNWLWSARLVGTLEVGSDMVGCSLGGRGGDTEGPSSLQMGDMLEPEMDMLGEVAGELVMN